MISRIRERRAFDRLARTGTRIRSASLWCTYLPDPTLTGPHVGFAIGRAVGPATVRNRLRRRLRAVLATPERAALLGPSLLLVGARPTAVELTFEQLTSEVDRLLARLPRPPVA